MNMVVLLMMLLAQAFATGPAPNAGDGVADGSGMHSTVGPSGNTAVAPGPAPNSGDGIPDGSGF
jgi:hypothetical protein